MIWSSHHHFDHSDIGNHPQMWYAQIRQMMIIINTVKQNQNDHDDHICKRSWWSQVKRSWWSYVKRSGSAEVCCCESDSVSVGVLPPCLTLHCHNAPATDQHDDRYIHDLPKECSYYEASMPVYSSHWHKLWDEKGKLSHCGCNSCGIYIKQI